MTTVSERYSKNGHHGAFVKIYGCPECKKGFSFDGLTNGPRLPTHTRHVNGADFKCPGSGMLPCRRSQI